MELVTYYPIIMKKYISHLSAACMWDIPYLDNVIGAEQMYVYRSGKNIDITVTDPNMLHQVNYHRAHLCGLPLPRGGIVKHGDNFIASPELVFLELANHLNIHQLILLGLQICSHPAGKSSNAISTKRKLNSFVMKAKKHHGRYEAKRALKYIRDGSASLMESLAFMIFTLPHLYGGYGLDGACFNQEVLLDADGRHQLKQKRCFVDLYYSKVKLAVEYDSFAYHNTPSEQGKDLIRSAILEHHGIEVMRCSTIQLYDKEACEKFVHNLASRLGKRIRIRYDGFQYAHDILRSLLPTREKT